MVDIVLTLALVALTVVSLLYISGCDHLRTDGSEPGASEASSSSSQGR